MCEWEEYSETENKSTIIIWYADRKKLRLPVKPRPLNK